MPHGPDPEEGFLVVHREQQAKGADAEGPHAPQPASEGAPGQWVGLQQRQGVEGGLVQWRWQRPEGCGGRPTQHDLSQPRAWP